MPLAGEVFQFAVPPPAWLQLGAPTEVDGVMVREILGDFSDLNPWDRPPKYVLDAAPLGPGPRKWDTSETREAVKQTYPGRPVSELQGIGSGRVAILFNGPSLKQHDLFKIPCPIIGMNRTHLGWKGYEGPQPDWLCLIDHVWFDVPKMMSALTHPAIINGGTHKNPQGWRIPKHPRMSPWSFDLARDGYAGNIPCTTGYMALQLAVWMGFTEIFCLGLDMGGGHFDGTQASLFYPTARAHLRRMAKRLGEVRPDVKVWVCGSPQSQADAFEKCGFGVLVGGAEAAA